MKQATAALITSAYEPGPEDWVLIGHKQVFEPGDTVTIDGVEHVVTRVDRSVIHVAR